MSRRMLINAQRPEELRVAIVDGTSLEGYQVEVAAAGLTRGNIYRGMIANIQPSLNAAFIDYDGERHGFLPIQDVVPQAYYKEPAGAHPRIEEVLERGKPIVIQVAKDAVGDKGASLTTNLSLAGRYLVLTPFDDTRGVSRKVEDEDVRKKLRQLAGKLELPDGCGVIVRTNALDQTKLTLSRDLAALLRLWKRVQSEARHGKGTRLLYSDQDLIVQALRDHLDATIEEVLVDDDDAFERAAAYMQAFMPRAKTQLVRYADRLPLFSKFEVEPQLERIHERRVPLPSGGSIVIDATEALTAIDVNSGRSTRAASQEETALNTNVEAAREVARQLRLRDIGGLVVVDFIDMRAAKNQKKVEKVLRDSMKDDKARSSVGRISPNGLLEINRQRIRQALALRTHRSCPTCGGSGSIASPEMVALSLLRRIEARAASGKVEAVRIALHPELADALQNSRRQELADMEREFELRIEIVAAPGLHRAEEKVDWTHRDKPKPPPPPRAVTRILKAADLAPLEDEPEEEPAPQPAAAQAREPGEGRGPERRPERPPGGPERPHKGPGREHRSGRDRGPGREHGPGRDRGPGREQGPARPQGPDRKLPGLPLELAEPGEGGGRKRKRRRGGRKRKKGGVEIVGLPVVPAEPWEEPAQVDDISRRAEAIVQRFSTAARRRIGEREETDAEAMVREAAERRAEIEQRAEPRAEPRNEAAAGPGPNPGTEGESAPAGEERQAAVEHGSSPREEAVAASEALRAGAAGRGRGRVRKARGGPAPDAAAPVPSEATEGGEPEGPNGDDEPYDAEDSEPGELGAAEEGGNGKRKRRRGRRRRKRGGGEPGAAGEGESEPTSGEVEAAAAPASQGSSDPTPAGQGDFAAPPAREREPEPAPANRADSAAASSDRGEREATPAGDAPRSGLLPFGN